MALLVLDPGLAAELKAQRVEFGSDRWDEVWDGTYVISPLPNIEHQALVTELICLLQTASTRPDLGRIFPGVNVSDREDDWTQNYRCPDVAVFLPGGAAIDRDTHWLGGPDFAVEIITPQDRVHEKLPFYAKVGVREILAIDRFPWRLELFRLQEGRMVLAGSSTPDRPDVLVSEVVPLTFRLAPGETRPRIEVIQSETGRSWVI